MIRMPTRLGRVGRGALFLAWRCVPTWWREREIVSFLVSGVYLPVF